MSKLVMVLAPHPDDECITGLLPLRLQEECGMRILVVPATLGSRISRRSERRQELQAACATLGFGLRFPRRFPGGMMDQKELRALLDRQRPAVVVLPHIRDGHPTHAAVHRLGVAAMDGAHQLRFQVLETEYWHPLLKPNLMVAANLSQVRRLCAALSCHRGEVQRNDYAARLPAWMIDNVRRGAERVGTRGAQAPAFSHATLYRTRTRTQGAWRALFPGGRFVESSADLAALASLWDAPA